MTRASGWGLPATLTLAMAVATFTQFALGVLGPFVIVDLQLSRTAFGSLTAVLFGVAAVLSPVAGPLVDRWGGRRMLVALFVAHAAGAIGAAAARSLAALLAAVGVSGVAIALANPATNQLLAVHVPAARQGVTTGVKQSGVQVGAFLAGATLPTVARVLGWRGALGVSAAAAVAGLAVTLRAVPTAASEPGATERRSDRPAQAALTSDVAWLAVYAGLMGAGVAAVTAYLPLFAVERLGVDAAAAGLAAALVGLVGVVARIGWGRRQDRSAAPVTVTLRRIALGAVVACALLWAAEAFGPALLWVGAVLLGATAVAWNAVGMLAIVRGVDVRLAGRASGRVLLGFFVGFIVSPVAFGWLVDRTGRYDAGWAATTLMFAAAALLVTRWRRG